MATSNQSLEQNTPHLVKTDPTGKVPKNSMLIIIILGLLWFCLAIFNLAEGIIHGRSDAFSFLFCLFIVVMYLAVLFLLRKRARVWKLYEQRRQFAAKGEHEQVVLATEQPVPDAFRLSSSTILRAKNHSGTYIFIFGLFFIVIVIIILMVEFLSNAIGSTTSTIYIYVSTTTILINAVIVGILLLLASVGVVLASRQAIQQLEFTETGLLKRSGIKVTVVLWDEARLFAIVPANPVGKRKSGLPVFYELSSAKEVLRWSASERMTLFGSRLIGTSAYYQQMQALLSVIAAKTGLPLYDLR